MSMKCSWCGKQGRPLDDAGECLSLACVESRTRANATADTAYAMGGAAAKRGARRENSPWREDLEGSIYVIHKASWLRGFEDALIFNESTDDWIINPQYVDGKHTDLTGMELTDTVSLKEEYKGLGFEHCCWIARPGEIQYVGMYMDRRGTRRRVFLDPYSTHCGCQTPQTHMKYFEEYTKHCATMEAYCFSGCSYNDFVAKNILNGMGGRALQIRRIRREIEI